MRRGRRNQGIFTRFEQKIDKRNVLIERVWDEKFFRDELNFEFLKRLKDWGWWPLFSDNRSIYPHAVKAFYFFSDNGCYVNGELKGPYTSKLTTRVLNKDIVVDGDKHNRILRITHVNGDK